MMNMTPEEFRRAVSMWGIALCLVAAAAGWVFMRFGQAWSIGDLPTSNYVSQIVPAYVVAEVALIPVGGKLVDALGVKKVLAVAPFVFIISSLLCMIAPSVEFLILCRMFQGAGAGLILAVAFTAVGKYYDNEKCGKCNELMTGAFAIGSLFGTAFGYFLTETFNWRMGFVVLSAMVFVGFILAWRFLPEREADGRGIDTVGMLITALVFGVATLYTQTVNVNFDLISLPSLLIAVIVTILVIILLHRMHNSEHPVIPVRTSLFVKQLTVLMFMFSLCGLGLIQYFFKLYLTYYDFNIYKATSMFLYMLGGAAIPSIIGSRIVYRTGARPWILVGSVIVTVSLIVTHFIADKGVVQLAISLFMFGFGLGCIVTEIICSMQTVVDKKDMGQHTGNLMAVRMVGIMAGNGVIGAYIGGLIHENNGNGIIDLSASDNLLNSISELIASSLEYVKVTMDTGFLMSALVMAVLTALLAIVAYRLGKDDLDALEASGEEDDSVA